MIKDQIDRLGLILAVVLTAAPSTLQAQTAAPPQPSTWGIGTLIHPLQLNDVNLADKAKSIPQAQKDHVHFFLINGFDPLYSGNLNGLAAYCQSVGFAHTTCYQLAAAGKARRQIEAVRRADPEARVVLLGYSLGANAARSVANDLQRSGIHVDCLIYVGGDTIFNSPTSRPANVGQIININGHGLILLGRDLYFKGDDLDGAVNRRVDVRHILLPVQRETINLVGHGLITAATSAPAGTEPPALQAAR